MGMVPHLIVLYLVSNYQKWTRYLEHPVYFVMVSRLLNEHSECVPQYKMCVSRWLKWGLFVEMSLDWYTYLNAESVFTTTKSSLTISLITKCQETLTGLSISVLVTSIATQHSLRS